MPLPSFLQRFRAAAGARAARGAEGARGASAALAADEEEIRARARRRLIGASLLVAAAVIGFPLLFDSQPRPLPGDVGVQIVTGASATRPGTAGSTGRSTAGTVADAGAEDAPPARPAATDAARAAADHPQPAAPERAAAADDRPVERSTERVIESPADRSTDLATDDARRTEARRAEDQRKAEEQRRADEQRRAQVRETEATRAKALLEGRPPASSPAAAGRFVVQIGAFADPAGVRDARAKVEKLGLKTYTQAIGDGATRRIRVRVGPFADRAEAERAAARLRQAGMAAAILTL